MSSGLNSSGRSTKNKIKEVDLNNHYGSLVTQGIAKKLQTINSDSVSSGNEVILLRPDILLESFEG